MKLSLLQSFTPETITAAVKVQYFALGAFAINKHVQVTRERVFLHLIFHHGCQTIKGFAHVSRWCIKLDANTGFGEEHTTLAVFSE